MKFFRRAIVTLFLVFLFSIQTFAGWEQAGDNQWKYEQEGIFLSNQWIEDQGNWYYLDENGLMLSNVVKIIDGVAYSFDSTGKCLNPGQSGRIFMNDRFGYSICIPNDVSTNAFDGDPETFDISTQNMLMSFYSDEVPENLDPETYANVFEMGFVEGIEGNKTFIEKKPIQIGDFHFTRTRYIYSGNINLDFYVSVQGHKMLAIAVVYIPKTEGKTQDVLNSLIKV